MKGIIFTLALLFGLAVVFTAPTIISAAPNPLGSACEELSGDQRKESAACEKVKEDDKGNPINPISGGSDSILYKITLIISAVAGVVAVMIIIIAGISMITAGGDSQKFANGRNTIIFAVVGLIVIILAQAIITFIVTRFTDT